MEASTVGWTLWTGSALLPEPLGVSVRVSPCPAPEDGVRSSVGTAGSRLVVLAPSAEVTVVPDPARRRIAVRGEEVKGASTCELPWPVVTAAELASAPMTATDLSREGLGGGPNDRS